MEKDIQHTNTINIILLKSSATYILYNNNRTMSIWIKIWGAHCKVVANFLFLLQVIMKAFQWKVLVVHLTLFCHTSQYVDLL